METINERVLPLSNDNYELWLLRYAEGELSAAEGEAVEAWLKEHPEAAEELALYREAPRLERDEGVVYAATVPQPSKPLWSSGWRWAAAAAVVLLLAPAVWRFIRPQEEPLQVAVVEPRTADILPTTEDTARCVPTETIVPAIRTRGMRRGASEENKVAEMLADVESHESTEEMPDYRQTVVEEPPVELFVAETLVDTAYQIPTEEMVFPVEQVVEMPALIYVDNLFVVDSGDAIEQRLLAINDAAKERLQGFYLGRRLARRLPSDVELLDYTSDLRERVPQGVRVLTDMFLAFNETNKQ